MDLTKLRGIAGQQLYKNKLLGWTFAISNTGRRLGVCKYREKRIEIAEHYAKNSPETNVMDTLMHEIAHAIAGPAAGHGPIWKAIAKKLGATPAACDSAEDTVTKPGDWQAKCPSCQKVYNKYKRPKYLTGYRCKCPARSPVVFKFQGDPALQPIVPLNKKEAAKWQAKCAACGIIHFKMRKPTKVYGCKCRRPGCELKWKLVETQRAVAKSQTSPEETPEIVKSKLYDDDF